MKDEQLAREIGKKIKQLRTIENSLSQEKMASLLGCSQSHVSDWESGKRFPQSLHIYRMCMVFKKSLSYFDVKEYYRKCRKAKSAQA